MTFTGEHAHPTVTGRDHSLGDLGASVTVVEFGEFECPHCGRAYIHLKGLRERLDDLDARFVWRHLARDDVHPFSVRAAVAAEAAGAQGRFWEMHDHLFEHQHSLEYEDLRNHAAAVGLDVERFIGDMSDPQYIDVVRSHADEARVLGVEGTPAFLINGERYEGAYDLDSLIAAIETERSK